MKKNYLLVAIFLNLLTLNSFAFSLKTNNISNDLEVESITQLTSGGRQIAFFKKSLY